MLLFVVENSKSHFVNLFDPHLLPCREIRDISAFDCNYHHIWGNLLPPHWTLEVSGRY